jgi:hypothetical protein
MTTSRMALDINKLIIMRFSRMTLNRMTLNTQ